jgi:hypothetical protein
MVEKVELRPIENRSGDHRAYAARVRKNWSALLAKRGKE